MASDPKVPAWCRPEKTRFKKSQVEESRFAESMRGKPLARSGGKRLSQTTIGSITQSGDLQTDSFLVEHKRTAKVSIVVKLEWFLKVINGAKMALRTPGVCILFENLDGRPREWIFLPKRAFERRIPLHEAAFAPFRYRARAGSFELTAGKVQALVSELEDPARIPRYELEWGIVTGPFRVWYGVPAIDALPYLREEEGSDGA